MTTTTRHTAPAAPSRDESDRSTVTSRRAGVLAGALMLLGTVTYATGSALIQSVAAGPADLAGAAAERSRVFSGVLLLLVNNAAVVGIGVALFQILRRRHHVVAVTYLLSRVIESTLMSVGAIAPLLFVTLGRGGSSSEPDPTIAQMLVDFRDISFQFAMIGLGIGSLVLTYTLYTRRLAPRTIAGIGIVGYVFLVTWGALSVLQGGNASMVLFAPGAVFEVALPVWLFARGFAKTA